MNLGRTYLMSSLIGVSLWSACDEGGEPASRDPYAQQIGEADCEDEADDGSTDDDDGSSSGPLGGTCESLPPAADYAAPGPFPDAMMLSGTGPLGNYTLFRPGASLGKDGFKHPIGVWGNGILTTPDQYQTLLTLIATHGFVVIACNDIQAERPCLNDGLDWLVQQNTSGDLAGKLDTSREVTIGYSWGGGAAIDAANRPNVKATVSLHGMPPRGLTALGDIHDPLLLFSSTGDSFVSAGLFVQPNFDNSAAPTFFATLDDPFAGHLYIADVGATACVASFLLGECGGAEAELAPTVAWLRHWACGDQAAERYFSGPDCVLCKSPFTNPQRKSL